MIDYKSQLLEVHFEVWCAYFKLNSSFAYYVVSIILIYHIQGGMYKIINMHYKICTEISENFFLLRCVFFKFLLFFHRMKKNEKKKNYVLLLLEGVSLSMPYA